VGLCLRPNYPSPRERGPEWVNTALDGSMVVSGRLLAVAGLPVPTLDPEQAMLFELNAGSETLPEPEDRSTRA
jgi:hypothetical protein